jgi:hypothetical protein
VRRVAAEAPYGDRDWREISFVYRFPIRELLRVSFGLHPATNDYGNRSRRRQKLSRNRDSGRATSDDADVALSDLGTIDFA